MNDNDITMIEGMILAMNGESPSKAIENQEKRGQEMLVVNSILPRKANDNSIPYKILTEGTDISMDVKQRFQIANKNNIAYTKEQYKKMGIIVAETEDDLFYDAVLPEGWELKKTEHPMWSELIDNKGRKRATIFYKAAFYDRDAFINFQTRFHLEVTHTAPVESDYEVWEKSDYQGNIKDGNEVIYSTKCVPAANNYDRDRVMKRELQDELEKYMKKHYPEYKDINAYWD